MEKSLREIQEEQDKWSNYNFKNRKPYQPLLGAMEELGELAHAHLKMEQNIRGSLAEHREEAADAIADVIIYLIDYCNQEAFDLQSTLNQVWERVAERDWVKFPGNGRTA